MQKSFFPYMGIDGDVLHELTMVGGDDMSGIRGQKLHDLKMHTSGCPRNYLFLQFSPNPSASMLRIVVPLGRRGFAVTHRYALGDIASSSGKPFLVWTNSKEHSPRFTSHGFASRVTHLSAPEGHALEVVDGRMHYCLNCKHVRCSLEPW